MRLLGTPAKRLGYVAAPVQGTAPGLNVVRLHHLFGSEENSTRAKPIQERMPQPYVALSPATAAQAGVQQANFIQFTLNGENVTLPLRQDAALADGVLGLPVGFPGVPLVPAGAKVTAVKGANA